MHPQIVSHEPGICPICRMQLTPVEDAGMHGADATTRAPAGAVGKRAILFYRHPMRADVTSPVPAKDEMGMDYVPVYAEDVSPGGGESVKGRASFTLPIERQQLIGVTRAPVERRPLTLEIRTVGKVAYDPGLYQAVVEYREAIVARGQLAESPWPDARRGADAIVRAAHLKLRQQGLSDEQIRQMAGGGHDPIELLLPGKGVWVYAQVYEYEVELIQPGQPLVITAPSLPGRSWTAAVAAVDPILSAATRTARVRARVATPDESLRPEMFVHARIEVSLGELLAIPEEAVLYTGEHTIVFVVVGEGTFEPRAVRLGRAAAGYSEVLEGLTEGEQVVTSANFLIDSESRFRAALAAFGKKAAAPHAH
jgi:multidrug efflux pump subunit AcrA (membrane-fusion protein)